MHVYRAKIAFNSLDINSSHFGFYLEELFLKNML